MSNDAKIAELEQRARRVRRDIVELAHSSRSGHIGSSMSCVDALVALHFHFLRIDPKDPRSPNRDRFLMSKGHACVPLYSCLEQIGFLPTDVLRAYGCEGGELGHHPKLAPQFGIEFGTGSLGHGLSIASGRAFIAKREKLNWRSVVMMSDGEQGEGTVWEAAMFAAHHGLESVLAVIDVNKMQALGNTAEILGLEPLDERWRSFGWGVRRVDGHDMRAVCATLDQFPFERGKPSVIVCDTIKGRGVSFMEGQLLWHYRCPDEKELAAALKELADA